MPTSEQAMKLDSAAGGSLLVLTMPRQIVNR